MKCRDAAQPRRPLRNIGSADKKRELVTNVCQNPRCMLFFFLSSILHPATERVRCGRPFAKRRRCCQCEEAVSGAHGVDKSPSVLGSFQLGRQVESSWGHPHPPPRAHTHTPPGFSSRVNTHAQACALQALQL